MASPILTSILDNDFYKFTMQQGVIRLFPYAKARYEFINRGNHKFPPLEACPHGEGWTPVVKLSDEKGKYTADNETILLAKQILGIA